MPLRWISRDGKIVIAARSLRTFATGFIAILLAVYLARLGFSLIQVGAFFSFGVAGSAFFAFIVGIVAEKVGRRRILAILTLLTAASGVALATTNNVLILTGFAFLGTLTGVAGGGGSQPTQPLEQATLADAAPAHKRTDLFAIYRIYATVAAAFGLLAAGLPDILQPLFGIDETASYRIMFLAFSAILVVVALLYLLLSSAVEVHIDRRGWVNPMTLPSRRVIFTLTALFSIDHFGGQLLIQTLVAYWFNTKFGLEIGSIAVVFFSAQILAATSLWTAAKLANRIGLINTMVFTHIPSSLFLIGAAFSPYAWMAILFWQLRSFFGQMDVPTRDSYTMAIVGPEERVAMASIHVLGRSGAGIIGPTLGTFLWQTFSAAAPFVGTAVVKITYDISLYFMFRNVKPPEEAGEVAQPASAEAAEPASTSASDQPPPAS